MRPWFNRSPLYNADPSPGGGSDTALIDPGAPFEHGDTAPPVVETPKPVKSAEAIELEALRADLARERTARSQAEENAQYWANRGKQAPPREEREEPQRETKPAPIAEKPEKLLDDITTEGIEALKKRGVITGAELATILEEHSQKLEGRMQSIRQDAEFSARIANEFPEIVEDSNRLSRGERPQTEVFQAAQRIYRQMVADDPALEGTNGALLIAARQAKAEIAAKVKPAKEATVNNDDRQETRRTRIDRQRGERTAAGAEGDEGHQDGFNKQQLEVMSRLKVTPENFRKHAGATRNGR